MICCRSLLRLGKHSLSRRQFGEKSTVRKFRYKTFENKMSWNLPPSSGPYPTACCDILDKPGLDSSLFRIYYPTQKFEADEKNCPEWMGEEQRNAFANMVGNGLCGKIVKCFLKGKRVPVYWKGPLEMPMSLSQLPVVIVSHGLGLSKNGYSHISYEIASHGYLVAALDHRDGSACSSMYLEKDESGEYVKKFLTLDKIDAGSHEEQRERFSKVDERGDDVIKVLDCVEQLNDGRLNNLLSPDFDLNVFKDKIDVKKVGVVGHSIGGATMVASLAKDPRFRVGIGLDSWTNPINEKYYEAKVETPVLFINANYGDFCRTDVGILRRLEEKDTGVSEERKLVTLKGAVHMTQCDMTFFPKNSFIAQKIMMRGPTDPKITNGINLKLMLGFMGKHLDLPFTGEVEKIVAENQELVQMGSRTEFPNKETENVKIPPVGIKVY